MKTNRGKLGVSLVALLDIAEGGVFRVGLVNVVDVRYLRHGMKGKRSILILCQASASAIAYHTDGNLLVQVVVHQVHLVGWVTLRTVDSLQSDVSQVCYVELSRKVDQHMGTSRSPR